MTERPLLMSGPMVRAILDGPKTQTRRVVKPRHDWRMDEREDGSPRPEGGAGVTALSHADIERFRHARSPRELSAVLAEVEPRLGREVTVGDLEELVTGQPVLPTPAEDSPERLRERREALGWTTAYAGHWVAWFDHTDVERAECGRGVPAFVARYAAALSAEEARRAAVGAWAAGGGVLHYSRPTEPERPAPRFKVGDWVRVNDLGAAHHGHTYQIAEIYGSWHRKVRGDLDCSYMARNLEPASPPAPEVVDVPQPIVKRVSGVIADGCETDQYATWHRDTDLIHVLFVRDDSETSEQISLPLLRAMLEAIDAQQGGAS